MRCSRIAPLAVLLLTAPACAWDAQTIHEWLDIVSTTQAIPVDSRVSAANALMQASDAEVMPPLVHLLAAARPPASSHLWGVMPDMAALPPGEQAYVELMKIWASHTRGAKPPRFAQELIAYLQDPSLHDAQDVVLSSIDTYWSGEAQTAVHDLVQSSSEPLTLRFKAATVLANHARGTYLPELLDLVQTHPGREADDLTKSLLTTDKPKYDGSPVEAKLLIQAFAMMEREQQGDPSSPRGYWSALDIGQFASAPMSADPKDPRYHKPDGNLAPAFFEVPVDRARAWWKEHEATVRKAAEIPRETPASRP